MVANDSANPGIGDVLWTATACDREDRRADEHSTSDGASDPMIRRLVASFDE